MAAHRGEQLAQLVAGLGGAAAASRAPSPRRRSPSRRPGTAPPPDRSGSICPGPAGQPARLDPPDVGRGVVDAGAGRAQHLHRHPQVRRARHRRPDVAHDQAAVEVGRGQQQPGDELARRRGVDGDLAAAYPAGAVHGQRQAAARARARAVRPSVASGRASSGAIGRCRACGSPSKVTAPVGQAGDRRQEPHHRAGQPDVDVGRSAQRLRPDHPAAHRPQWRPAAPMRAQPGRHQLGVAGPQRVAQGAGAVETAASTRARAVIDFEPGSRTDWPPGRWAVGAVHAAAGGGHGAGPVPATLRHGLMCWIGHPPLSRYRWAHVRAVRVDAQRGRSGRRCSRRWTRRTAASCPTTTSRPTDPVPIVRVSARTRRRGC